MITLYVYQHCQQDNRIHHRREPGDDTYELLHHANLARPPRVDTLPRERGVPDHPGACPADNVRIPRVKLEVEILIQPALWRGRVAPYAGFGGSRGCSTLEVGAGGPGCVRGEGGIAGEEDLERGETSYDDRWQRVRSECLFRTGNGGREGLQMLDSAMLQMATPAMSV